MTSIEDTQVRKRDYEAFDGETQLEDPCSIPPEYEYLVNWQSQSQMEEEDGSKRPASSMQPPPTNLPTAFAAMKGNGAPPAKKTKLTFAERSAEIELKRINKEIEDQEIAEKKARQEAEKARLLVANQQRTPKEIKEQEKAEAKARAAAEKEAERVETKARKDAEREAEKEVKKKAAADEKARKREADDKEKRAAREAELEEKRAAKEEERKKKEAEKAIKDEKKRLKDEDKRLKDEEKRKKDEEKQKKERSQLKLGNFFAIPASSNRSRSNSMDSHGRSSKSPAPSQPAVPVVPAFAAVTTPSRPGRTPYDDLFPSFYKKDDVTVAPISRFERDDEATEFLQKEIDGYLTGNRTPDTQRSFGATRLFHLNSIEEFRPRGRNYIPVRDIMSQYHPGNSSKMAIDLTTTDSQNSQIKRTRDMLRKIPLKILHFNEDVRPPYKGTYTKRPITSTSKLARNPMRRDLPDTNYDYDSEAEWVEDDGEDLQTDGEDEEDDGDGEEMDGFLDDENDESANSRRLVIQGDLEPISTGLCWEDRSKRNSNVKMVKYRMENILDPKIKSIDPFSTSYWQPVLLPMDPPRLPLHTMISNSVAQNGPSPSSKTVKPFFSPASEAHKASPTPSTPTPAAQTHAKSAVDKDGKPKKMLSPEDLPAFKTAVLGDDVNTLSKVGLVEVLKKRFPGRSGAAIKNTLEVVAERQGQKEKDKRWVLIAP